ncbi:MAG TPA: hypothetical protein PK523_05630 [Elusimicrobiales bacterium]|nr:hypothetical protein [Elusimicrobiales bacterium]
MKDREDRIAAAIAALPEIKAPAGLRLAVLAALRRQEAPWYLPALRGAAVLLAAWGAAVLAAGAFWAMTNAGELAALAADPGSLVMTLKAWALGALTLLPKAWDIAVSVPGLLADNPPPLTLLAELTAAAALTTAWLSRVPSRDAARN